LLFSVRDPTSEAPMNDTRLYHNPRCSKSRGALELLRERGIEPLVIAYLDNPPSAAELRDLLGTLGLPARELLRTGEDEYAALGLANESLAESALIDAMVKHPRLIERPIFVHGGRAVIGRPPERVLELLD
jgi:arsenate reductase